MTKMPSDSSIQPQCPPLWPGLDLTSNPYTSWHDPDVADLVIRVLIELAHCKIEQPTVSMRRHLVNFLWKQIHLRDKQRMPFAESRLNTRSVTCSKLLWSLGWSYLLWIWLILESKLSGDCSLCVWWCSAIVCYDDCCHGFIVQCK